MRYFVGACTMLVLVLSAACDRPAPKDGALSAEQGPATDSPADSANHRQPGDTGMAQRIERTPEQWRQQLTDMQFCVSESIRNP